VRYAQMERKQWVMFKEGGRPADPAQIILLTLAINYVQGVEDAFTKMQEGNPQGMVEYNQLQPLLKATGGKYAQGDANGADGYSPFPGNTNAIFAALPMYVAVLTRTGGMVPEFVNPKYKKGDGAGFQSPTRLECMMQDYARLLDEDAAVGFTSHPIEYGYFPCKNNLADAQALSAKGVPSYGAASSEMAVYAAHAAALRRTPGSGQRKATEKSRRFDARRKGGWQARDRATA